MIAPGDTGFADTCSELPYMQFTVQVPVISDDFEEAEDGRTQLAQTMFEVLTSSRPDVLETMTVEQAKRILVSIYRAIDQVRDVEYCEF